MKRIPLVGGLALAVVLVTVGVLVWPAYAVSGAVYCSCGGAEDYIGQKYADCMSHGGATFNSHCFDASEGNPGSYSYSCSWTYLCPGYDPYPVWNDHKVCGGGFGGGNVIDPTDPSCE
jgi:hypothetical protein